MANERKIRCDCGGLLSEKKVKFDHFETEALACPECDFITLTKEQAQKYIKLKQLHQIMDAERKVIKIGNSMGITFPDQLKDFGIKIGKKVKIEALTANSFKVELG